jgi:hypothetical protein
MANGKIPGVRQASIKEVRELLKLAWARDEELSDQKTDARLLPDGRVLLYWGEGVKGTLYPSREAFAEVKRQGAETMAKFLEERAKGGAVDPSLDLLPPIADFLRDVEAHSKKLGPRIGVADEALDFTAESLDAVDKALKKIPWAKRQVPDLVTPLVAYVGEVMRRASGGEWSTSSARGHENEPMVTAGNGRLFQPFALVFIPMIEPSKRIPLRSAVDTTLIVSGYRAAPKPAA